MGRGGGWVGDGGEGALLLVVVRSEVGHESERYSVQSALASLPSNLLCFQKPKINHNYPKADILTN